MSTVSNEELEAVNRMLRMINEYPVNIIEPSIGLAHIAQSVLQEVSRGVQSIGFEFNQEYKYELVPDIDGYIHVPTNVLKIDAFDECIETVRRGDRLYDKENQTYIFTENLDVNITWCFPYADLPFSAQEYISIRAARRFTKEQLGRVDAYLDSAEDEENAKLEFLRSETNRHRYNVLNSRSIQPLVNKRFRSRRGR